MISRYYEEVSPMTKGGVDDDDFGNRSTGRAGDFTIYVISTIPRKHKVRGSHQGRKVSRDSRKIDFDFEELGDVSDESVLSITFRTLTMDNLTKQFVERNPDGTVVSMASGLDFRHERIDNGKILWFDVELPEVIALRRRLFKESRRMRFIWWHN